jgi:hypothetical protein
VRRVQQQVLKGAAFKEYATKLREKSAQCKQLKTDLDRVLSDLGVSQRTEQARLSLCLSSCPSISVSHTHFLSLMVPAHI